ncbi:MAG: hypothetical protein QM654_14290 [Dysgonamonadaceae bacterium]
MNQNFINAVYARIQMQANDPLFSKKQTTEMIIAENVQKGESELTDYDLAFWELYAEQDILEEEIDSYLDLLDNNGLYKEDMSIVSIFPQQKALLLPEKDSSEWALLFRTLLLPDEQEGPFLQLNFNGWEVASYKIGYAENTETESQAEETKENEISEEDIYELIINSAKVKLDESSLHYALQGASEFPEATDMALWLLLSLYAEGKSPEEITQKIHAEFFLSGHESPNVVALEKVVATHKKILEKEISVFRNAFNMIHRESGMLTSTYETVYNLLHID